MLAGCAERVAPAGLAHDQPPTAGSPASAWRDTAGRCVVSGATRLSCRAVVRRDADGSVRLALLADEGLLLCDVAVTNGTATVHHAVPDLASHAAGLGQLAWQVWGGVAADHSGRWDGDAWLVDAGPYRRWFGGDPLLLRRIAGDGTDVVVGDYRPWQGHLLAYQAAQSGTLVTLTLHLGDPHVLAIPDLNQPAAR